MMNKETAMAFDSDISDGFVQPLLAWSATTPEHINGQCGSSMTSNFWIGSPEDVKKFANKIASFYKDFCANSDNFSEELEEEESISVLYWENGDIAMCADICTSDQIYDMLPVHFFEEASETLNQVLFNGNDNHPGLILEIEELSVQEKISLAKFMTYESNKWILGDDYRDDFLSDFTDDDMSQLEAAFQKG